MGNLLALLPLTYFPHGGRDGAQPIEGALCSPSGTKAHTEQWGLAVARARAAFAVASAYSLEAPTARKGGAEGFIGERARLRETFEA
jgi:hypothetical protein